MKNHYICILFIVTLTLNCGSRVYAGPRYVWDRTVETNEKIVCLTFDDGPNGKSTRKVLDVLKKYHTQATFFVIGKNVEKYPELTRRIVTEGHEVGNHSYTTGHFLFVNSAKAIKNNLLKTNDIIIKETGTQPEYFRPPNGLMTNTIERESKKLDLKNIGVNVFVFDNIFYNKNKIAKMVMKNIKGGPLIIVLHDGSGTRTVSSRAVISEVLEIIIPSIRKKGYRFANLEECVCNEKTNDKDT